MRTSQPLVLVLSALLSASGLVAQLPGKVLPRGMDYVEGPNFFVYPFGQQSGAIQILYEARAVTLGQGLVMGIRFRQSEVTASQLNVGYTKDYKITAYTVQTTAQNFVADLNLNLGGATGAVVFQGPVTLPPIQLLTTLPASFDIAISFTTPYTYDGTAGNLLLVVETDDLTTPPSGYRIDAVNFAFNTPTGLSTGIDSQGCASGGQALSLANSETNVVVGGILEQTLTSSASGAFPVAFAAIGFDAQFVDLTPFGMPGCRAWPVAPVAQLVLENTGGGYSPILWLLPNIPALEGICLVGQVLGVGASGQLQHCVTSNGVASRIGGANGPTVDMRMSSRNAAGGWFMGTSGVFVVVARLEGIFP